LATILVVLAAALLVPSAAAAKSEFFGIVQGPSLDDKDLVGLQRAHIHTVRYLLAWESIQPRSGSKFSWGSTNKFIGRLAAKGIRVLPSVWGNPSWVQGYTAHPPLDRPQDLQAWRNFLKALVAHYGPGGKYWTTTFKTKYPGATPLPITTWQIWNEPNLKKYFTPYPAPKLYGRLLKASHDAIKSKDPKAQVALAGMPGYGDVNAWDFLNQLYNQVASVKSYFEVASLHPYGPNIDKVKSEIQKFRDAMTSHADRATPLWITELGWGSAPPDRFGINKGPQGQAKMLKSAYKTILANRKTWNVQRLFWYHWRDPKSSHANCSFCASAGLIKFNRTAKPALAVFKSFTAETTPPTASITGGPSQGATITNPTPTFKFTSNEPGSTFECKLDAGSFTACSSPFKTPHLANGAHTFQVRAIDAPGNVGAPASRSFNVNAP
jgi:hypothetical protein